MADKFLGDEFFRGLGLDRYAISARMRPALFTLVPVFVLVGFWIPEARTVVGAIAGAASACGLTYFSAQIVRSRGLALERRSGDRVGRLHSARLLTFADRTFATETKKRYHAFLASKGIALSTFEEERLDQAVAFDRARSAIDWLLVYTLPNAKKSLIFEENIGYGFSRNLYAMKPIAMTLILIAMIANAGLMYTRWPDRSFMVGGVIIEAGLGALLFTWVFLVSRASVEEASLSYARRLFGLCEVTSAPIPPDPCH